MNTFEKTVQVTNVHALNDVLRAKADAPKRGCKFFWIFRTLLYKLKSICAKCPAGCLQVHNAFYRHTVQHTLC